MMARNSEFEREHPRNAQGEFTEKAGASAPRWMQDLDAKIEAEVKRRDAARQPGYVPERRSPAQQFAAAASAPSERDLLPGQTSFGRALSVEAAAQKKPTGLPQRRHAGDAVYGSVDQIVRATQINDQVVAGSLAFLVAHWARGGFPFEQLPAEISLLGTKTRARHNPADAATLHRLATILDPIITGQHREGRSVAETFSTNRLYGNIPWQPFSQHPGVIVPPVGG